MSKRCLALICLGCIGLLVAGCPPPEPSPIDSGSDTADASVETGEDADVGVSDGADADGGSVDDADTGPERKTSDYPLEQCDSLEPFRCALPWPSNQYLAPDDDRVTGYQLRFGSESLPATDDGDHVDPEPYRRLDGYGLGTPILTHFPGVDTSEMASRFDIAPSMASDASVVLLEVQPDGSTERVPYWAELDARAESSDKQLLIVRPAEILEEDTRYIVAFRDLETEQGQPIEASDAFAALRDGDVDSDSALEARRSRFDEVFDILDDAGISRSSLTLAWDFRTASGDGLRGQLRRMQRRAIDATGSDGPSLDFSEDSIQRFGKPGSGEVATDPHIGLEISGTFEVPHFTRKVDDDRSWVLNRNDDGKVAADGTRDAKFLMRVPHTAIDGDPAGVILYGHGLFQSRDSIKNEVWGRLADAYNYVLVATDWTGMAGGDLALSLSASSNVTNFQGVADRMHQGVLDTLMLGRTAKNRVPNLSALSSRGVDVEDDEVFYAGASQGGIYGQTFMAMTRSIERGFLAVPGNNYSTLLKRSVNFNQFLGLMERSYSTAATRTMCIATMQLLWTGTDPVSYATHIERDPLTSAIGDKDVLLVPSKGDYQVSVVTNEVLARSDAGIPIMQPYDEEHDPWNVATANYPRGESGIILFDFGNPWPRGRGNRPPRQIGDDPHDNLGQVSEAGNLIDSFFRDETIVDICGGSACNYD